MLPPTRARRGGRGLSLSLFSCLLDCRRPPGGAAPPQALSGARDVLTHPIPQNAPDSKTLQGLLQRTDPGPNTPRTPNLIISSRHTAWPQPGVTSPDSLCPSGLSSKSSSSSSEPMEYSDWLSESSSCHSVGGSGRGAQSWLFKQKPTGAPHTQPNNSGDENSHRVLPMSSLNNLTLHSQALYHQWPYLIDRETEA